MTGTPLVPVADRRTPLLLAVYGTLRRGCRNAHVLAGCPHVGDARVAGRLHEVTAPREELGYGYPLLVLDDTPAPAAPGSPTGTVRVEVYRVEDLATLLALDALEDYDPAAPEGSEYVRVRVPLLEPWSGAPEHVQVYVHAGAVERRGPLLEGGDWYLHAGERA